MQNRSILIKKAQLIDKIKENKEAHIKDYEEAVIAYRAEATKQILNLTDKLNNGNLNLSLNLVTPVNKSEEYDKILQLFEWEQLDEVSITSSEFQEYVLDQSAFSVQSKFLNSTYK